MKNKTVVIALVLVLLLGAAFAGYRFLAPKLDGNSLSAEEQQSVTETRPHTGLEKDFTVYDLQGNPVKLSDFVGKPMVLNFWSSRCGPCKMEMPDFQKAYDEFGDTIQFLMVNVTDGNWDTKESAMKFVEESGYTFPVYLDQDQNAAAAYRVFSLPTSYFFYEDGTLAAKATGAINAETLRRGIDMITKAP